MRAVISVVGKDRPGILAYVATQCAVRSINIVDVTQKVLQDLFTMIMIVEMPEDMNSFHQVQEEIEALGEPEHLKIHVMHEDIFNAMHTV
ncbi:MAG: ACT domain-containing protein [Solobacterium sp.]|jgi:ACT domain-containing protein|nr:ACT domain-containing protein [Solobacterium sp.]